MPSTQVVIFLSSLELWACRSINCLRRRRRDVAVLVGVGPPLWIANDGPCSGNTERAEKIEITENPGSIETENLAR